MSELKEKIQEIVSRIIAETVSATNPLNVKLFNEIGENNIPKILSLFADPLALAKGEANAVEPLEEEKVGEFLFDKLKKIDWCEDDTAYLDKDCKECQRKVQSLAKAICERFRRGE